MRAVIQRVTESAVRIDGEVVGRTGPGVLALVCAMKGDDDTAAEALAGRIAKLRIFADAEGRMNRSLLDTGGGALVVSQFTLAADTSRGNRPGFAGAAPPEEGRRLCDRLAASLAGRGVPVETGRFGADMQVLLVNDGPVTIWIET